MSNKNKKVFKKLRALAPKVSINNRWVNWRQNETKNRQNQVKNEIKKLVLKSLWIDQTIDLSSIVTTELQKKMWEISKRASDSHIKNYCHYIGRSRSYNRKMFMARHTLRKFSRFGLIPGLTQERV